MSGGLDLKAVHEALAGQIRKGIDDAGGFSIEAFPSTAPRPCVEVWPDDDYVVYHVTSGPEGLSDVSLVIRVWMSGANSESEWHTACALLSGGEGQTSSIHDAVMSDRTLGGVVASVMVATADWNSEDGTIDIPVAVQLNNQGGQV